MVKWIGKIQWGKVMLVGIIYTVVTMIVRQVESMMTLKWHQMPEYSGVWSKLMIPSAGPPPPEFFIVSTVATFLTGVSLCVVYHYLKEYLPKNQWQRACYFADLLVATSFIFFTVPVYMLFNVPLILIGSWFISGFILNLIASVLIVHLIPR